MVTKALPSRISIQRIKEAVTKIDPIFLNSPQYLSESLSNVLGLKIFLKNEINNPIKSFKGRGTELMASKLDPDTEVACASAGNFGQAMAYSCAKKYIQCTVYAGFNANKLKISKMKELGANVILMGDDFDEAKEAARYFAKKEMVKFVEDSLDIETVEGAGTIGLELLELPEQLDYIILPLGNGALATGVAKVIKEYSPETKIVAVQANGAPAMIESWKKGEIINYETANTIADGIAVRMPIKEVLNDMAGLIDHGLLVKEESIIAAMKLIKEKEQILVEPSSAVAIAAILEHKTMFSGKSVATIVCGGNITQEDYNNIISS